MPWLSHWLVLCFSLHLPSLEKNRHCTFDVRNQQTQPGIDFSAVHCNHLNRIAFTVNMVDLADSSSTVCDDAIASGFPAFPRVELFGPDLNRELFLYQAFFWLVQPQENKVDELWLWLTQRWKIRAYCAQIYTETWSNILYWDVALDGGTFLSADRTQDSSMTGGGGPCVYIHNAWSSNTVKVDGQYSPDFKFLMLRCQPYYLPR